MTKVYQDQQAINKQFGRSNLLVLMVPNTSTVKEKQLSDKLENQNFVKSVICYANKIPQGIPESFVPKSITELLHTKNYARLMVYTKTKDESPAAFRCADQVQSIMKSYYPQGSYIVGPTTFAQDIKTTINSDYNKVDAISILTVALVILVNFRSLLLPILLLVPIEIAVFINMVFPFLAGNKLMFVGYMVVGCIQLGSTVDYAILLTNNYLEYRTLMNRKEATIKSISNTLEPLLTSATILTLVGYTLYRTSSTAAIADIGHLIGRGTILSLLLVVTVLPSLLYIFDKPIMNNMARIQRMHERAKARRQQRKDKIFRKLKSTRTGLKTISLRNQGGN